MNTEPHAFVRTLVGDAPLTAIDVGARYDIPSHWIVLDGCFDVVAFEPDPEACAALRAVYDSRGHGDRYRNLPIAVSDTRGSRKLFVPNSPSGASLFSPETPINRAYVDHSYLYPIVERTVETRTLCDVLDEIREPRASMIKIDVEGAAMEVLKGLGDERIKHLVAIEAETEVTSRYQGQHTFFDLHALLSARGFEVFDARKLNVRLTREGRPDGYQRDVFGVHDQSPTVAPRLLGIDALFFRRADEVLSRGADETRRLAIAYCTYGFFNEAYNLLEQGEGLRLFSAAESAGLREAVVAWHNHGWAKRMFHRPTPFWGFVRRATKMVGMTDQVADQVERTGGRAVLRRIFVGARHALRS
jgi:FkbM family methyltransferase